MKKIMIAAAIALAAVVSQAAVAVTWNTGTGVKDVDGNAFTTATTGYLAEIVFSTSADMSEVFAAGGTLSTSSYKTKGSVGFGGISTAATFDAGTYYARITITTGEGPSAKVYTSEVGSFTIAAGQTAGTTINFTSGLNMGGSSLIGDMRYVGAAVPEPTSALLMLLGMAGLALKRKRA